MFSSFTKENSSLPFQNLQQLDQKQSASSRAVSAVSGDQLLSKNSPSVNKAAALSKMYYLFIDNQDMFPIVQQKMTAAYFPSNTNLQQLMLSFDGEWYQPVNSRFTDRGTIYSLLQFSLRRNPLTSSASADDESLTFIIDLLPFNENKDARRALCLFLAWLFQATGNQPCLCFSVKHDAKVLASFGIDLGAGSSFNQFIFDLQLFEILISGSRIQPGFDGRTRVCLISGLMRVVQNIDNLTWFVEMKNNLKLRDEAQKINNNKTADHFIKRPIDAETMIYSVLDSALLFNILFEKKKKQFILSVFLSDEAKLKILFEGGSKMAKLELCAVELRFEENACLPLGIFEQVDGNYRGTHRCSKCRRNVAPKDRPCTNCRWIEENPNRK